MKVLFLFYLVVSLFMSQVFAKSDPRIVLNENISGINLVVNEYSHSYSIAISELPSSRTLQTIYTKLFKIFDHKALPTALTIGHESNIAKTEAYENLIKTFVTNFSLSLVRGSYAIKFIKGRKNFSSVVRKINRTYRRGQIYFDNDSININLEGQYKKPDKSHLEELFNFTADITTREKVLIAFIKPTWISKNKVFSIAQDLAEKYFSGQNSWGLRLKKTKKTQIKLLNINGTHQIEFAGSLGYRYFKGAATFNAFFNLLKPSTKLTLVMNNFGGGYNKHVKSIKKVLRGICEEGHCKIITIVPKGKSCYSACIPLFMLGSERIAYESSLFKFHQSSFQIFGKKIKAIGVAEREARSAGINRNWISENKELFAEEEFKVRKPSQLDGSNIVTVIRE